MKRLSIMALSAVSLGVCAGAARVEAQDAAGRIETPTCSFVCAMGGGGAPAEAKPVAVSADPAHVEAATTAPSRHARLAVSQKILTAKLARTRHVAARAAPRRPTQPVAAAADAGLPAARPMEPPEPTLAAVDLRHADVTSPVVQIENGHSAQVDAIVPRRIAERAADDLHLDVGLVTGDVEVSGFTRYAPSWDWLITRAHAATVRRPDPYGDLDGVRNAF